MNKNKFAEEYQTDLLKWRLRVDEGRQVWTYLETDQDDFQNPQTFVDKYWIGLSYVNNVIYSTLSLQNSSDIESSLSSLNSENFETPKTPREAAVNGYRFFRNLQTEDGHWAGAHFEGKSTVFGTAMNYVALRILGVQPDHPVMIKARNTLHKLGSAKAIASWGKFWLSVLGVYEWEGMNPVPPEPWLLPSLIPLNPGNWWVHTRAVFLGMCHVYAMKWSMPLNKLTRSLREELYTENYDEIDWKNQKDNVSEADRYVPNSFILKTFNSALSFYEKYHSTYLRKKATQETLLQIHLELENTKYLCLAPVNFAVNMVVMYFEHGEDSTWFKGMLARRDDVMWLCREGLAGCGTNGSQLWDTAFAVQAVVSTGLGEMKENRQSMVKALEFLGVTQIKENPRDFGRCYRQKSKGAWPFSTRDQGYTVSDTTSEALKATIMLQNLDFIEPLISKERLQDCVDILLDMQNPCGGFASYEKVRAPHALEMLNAAEVFGDIMTEYTYPECTTSVVLGLSEFKAKYPTYRRQDIDRVISSAVASILAHQKSDGSWFGSWGICFTYATMFALNSLSYVDKSYANDTNVKKACEFLLSHQNEDGGWGESYASCETGVYSPHPDGSQVVNTAFALLALIAAKYPEKEPLSRGIKLLMDRQQPNGEWLQEGIEGVFNRNCMIAYPNYKFIFSIWALGKYDQNHC
ncbi:Protostadienol synthase A [Zancudomyces culisetae]|uniref:Terpene cyclase/mutase family member n=1 Tax=Zancudomyces culisetae TaxID=1213189 RepID=A0A1R1PGN9_ZANCU|nr:Protostadienol synthase A [Zancudomyces culisetae]|eukprot:OMH80144.1 Protostadienol synthase A [Zancudomyces culisetae]